MEGSGIGMGGGGGFIESKAMNGGLTADTRYHSLLRYNYRNLLLRILHLLAWR